MEMNQSETALRELEREIHTDIIPGTEIMTDVGQYHFVKSQNNKTVLVPQPCNDPSDPLNWSPWWKFCAVGSSTLTMFTQILGPLAIAPIFPILEKEFDSDLDGVVKFTGVTILVLGFSNFIWITVAYIYGRRFALLTSTAVLIGSCIWRARATSYNSFYGAAILSGIGGSPGETMEPLIIADVMFLHERGFYNTLYFAVVYGSTMLGPILQGVMAQRYGWRSFWWMNAAINIFAFLLMLVAFPETMYHRPSAQSVHPQPSLTAEEAKASHTVDVSSKEESTERKSTVDVHLGNGKPRRRQFNVLVFDSKPWLKLVMGFYVPFKLLLFPIALWAALIITFASNCYLMITFVQASAFAIPPYNFDPSSIGYTNFASLIGALIGLLSAGPLSDWVSAKLTARNNGVREPEMRLLAMIPYAALMILGNFVTAFGLQHQWDWRAIVIVGFGIAGITVAALPSISATYAVDSYKAAAGYLFVTITIVKNVYGYGISHFITPWVQSSGYLPTFMTNMCILTLWLGLAGGLWVFGKRLRTWTAKSDVHRL